jgi:hypothetical protein
MRKWPMTWLKDDLMVVLLTGGYEMKLQVRSLGISDFSPKAERKE